MMRTLLIALGIAAGVWAVAIVGLLVIGRRTAARQLATLLPNLVRLFRGLLRDPRVPSDPALICERLIRRARRPGPEGQASYADAVSGWRQPLKGEGNDGGVC